MGSKMEVSEAEIQKVYHRDCILLAGFAIFMWCILSTILRQALQVAGDSTTRTIMICIALVTGSALSLGFFAVYRHLKRNKYVIYKEDIENLKLQKKETKKEKIMQVIDVFFVMILCFVVLLVTMLFQNLAGVKEAGKAYVIKVSTLVPVVVALAAYVTFLVKRSKKDLKEIIELEYSEKEQE